MHPRTPRPLRLLVYDRTCYGRAWHRNLSAAWAAGSSLYRALGHLDCCQGVASWPEALSFLASCEPARPISEVQFWGHGRWGQVLVQGQALTEKALTSGHAWHSAWARIRERLTREREALLWLRTCESFGAKPGHDFARSLADFLGCRVAGHTYTIGFWQSGLHTLRPGQAPSWSDTEGLGRGTARQPEVSLPSSRHAPNTISCLKSAIPSEW